MTKKLGKLKKSIRPRADCCLVTTFVIDPLGIGLVPKEFYSL